MDTIKVVATFRLRFKRRLKPATTLVARNDITQAKACDYHFNRQYNSRQGKPMNDRGGPAPACFKQGFTLVEMLTASAIMVFIFSLLAIIFGRATTIHKLVRGGGDATNFGMYLMNTIVYGPGNNREEGLICAKPFTLNANTTPDTLIFQSKNGDLNITYYYISGAGNGSIGYAKIIPPINNSGFDLKPGWASDKRLEVFRESISADTNFYYYKNPEGTVLASGGDTVYAVGIKLVLKNTLQTMHEAINLYRCVRLRNQIEF
ncbi:MAG: prepilin-type N-terminal cleavage/methylation domain-containing protein [Candidatus Omnitrophota bacterium]